MSLVPRFVIGIVAMALCAGTALAAGAEVTSLEGEVHVARSGSRRAEAAFEGMQIPAGARVETGEDSTCTLVVGDVAIIDLEPGSVFRIPGDEDESSVSRVEVLSGGLWALVKSLGRGRKFEVMTRTAVAGVKGTQFRAFQHPGRQATASFLMVGGTVQLLDRGSRRVLLKRLTSGQKGSLTRKGGPVEVTEVSMSDITAEFGDFIRPEGDLQRLLKDSSGGGKPRRGRRGGSSSPRGGKSEDDDDDSARGPDFNPGIGTGMNTGPRVNPMPQAPPPPPPPPPPMNPGGSFGY